MWEQLLAVINSGNVQEATRLIGQMNANDFVKDYSQMRWNQSPLHSAEQHRLDKVVEALLGKMPAEAINAADSSKYTALHYAANEVVAGKLLQVMRPEAINAAASNGYTALHSAAANGRGKVVEVLLTRMSAETINAGDAYKMTALHYAARKGPDRAVQLLLGRMSAEAINAVNQHGQTAFDLAVQTRNSSIYLLAPAVSGQAKLIMQQKANLETQLRQETEAKEAQTRLAQETQTSLTQVNGQKSTLATQLAQVTQQKTNLETQLRQEIQAKDAQARLAQETQTRLTQISEEKTTLETRLQPFLDKEEQERSRVAEVARRRQDEEQSKQAAELKKLQYPPERIEKLLKIYFKANDKVAIKILHLADKAATDQQVQALLRDLEHEKVLAIAVHLGGDAWTSLVLKKDEDDLQILYNDPSGTSAAKTSHMPALLTAISECYPNANIISIDLRCKQQDSVLDSGALVVDNLIKLVNSNSSKKSDLQKLLAKQDAVSMLRSKHLITEETSQSYGQDKLNKILQLAVQDNLVIVKPAAKLEHTEELVANIRQGAHEAIAASRPAIFPVQINEQSWAGIIVRPQKDGSLQIIYTDPSGKGFTAQNNSISLVLEALISLKAEVQIIDLMHKQQNSEQDSGLFVIDNLLKLAANDTSGLHKDQVARLVATKEDASSIGLAQARLLEAEGIATVMAEDDLNEIVIAHIGGDEQHWENLPRENVEQGNMARENAPQQDGQRLLPQPPDPLEPGEPGHELREHVLLIGAANELD